ncbi:efflux RND transporter permease subunit, partial [Photobacterium sp. R1]
IYVRANNGELVSLNSVAKVEEVAAARKLSHNEKQKSITITANLLPGHTLGEALDFMDEQALSMLPSDIVIDYGGESKDFRENQS